VVLFAHGSRDPQWARPFEVLSKELGQKLVGVPVRLAYLEMMRPTLAEAIAALAAEGTRSVRIVPVFFGQGAHVREDLPKLVSALAAAHRDLELILEKPIGEQPTVIAAIAEAIAAGVPSTRGSSAPGRKR
jgi:sirohydrochlorin cobaltochelatase